jgi:ribosomal protein S18 acetylase RimI-like enzyme
VRVEHRSVDERQAKDYTIRSMTIEDHKEALQLWQTTEWISLSETDDREPMELFLDRNPGLSLVARDGDRLIGTILCSHDGRRGFLAHLAVDERYRRQGVGSTLVERCLSSLAQEGILKCNIFFIEENRGGIDFWARQGFEMLQHFGWMQKGI